MASLWNMRGVDVIKAAVFTDDDNQMFDWRGSFWRICRSVPVSGMHIHGARRREQSGGRQDRGAATPAGTAIARIRQQRSPHPLIEYEAGVSR